MREERASERKKARREGEGGGLKKMVSEGEPIII